MMNSSCETVKDSFHLMRQFSIGRVLDGILQKPSSEDGVSEQRRLALVFRSEKVALHFRVASTGWVIRPGLWV
jgi:hypothetical protein